MPRCLISDIRSRRICITKISASYNFTTRHMQNMNTRISCQGPWKVYLKPVTQNKSSTEWPIRSICMPVQPEFELVPAERSCARRDIWGKGARAHRGRVRAFRTTPPAQSSRAAISPAGAASGPCGRRACGTASPACPCTPSREARRRPRRPPSGRTAGIVPSAGRRR